jgi:hypothetical protein
MNNQQKREGRDDEREDDSSNRSHGEGTPIYLTSDSTLQSPEEHDHDKEVDPRQDNTREVSTDDLHEIKAGRLTGRESPGDTTT